MNGLRNLLKGKGIEIAKEAFDRTILVGNFLCFLHVTNTYICSPTLVPRGHIWIQGDNIYASQDSRHFDPVPYGVVRSKVFSRLLFLWIWPICGSGSLGQEI
ncbi:hypothetical protein MKX03_001183 [Papaver bracteatum]|nr:hypothetical protein MKX03_001183 [Papaver bracteatum]